jgi:hypothetical protein
MWIIRNITAIESTMIDFILNSPVNWNDQLQKVYEAT